MMTVVKLPLLFDLPHLAPLRPCGRYYNSTKLNHPVHTKLCSRIKGPPNGFLYIYIFVFARIELKNGGVTRVNISLYYFLNLPKNISKQKSYLRKTIVRRKNIFKNLRKYFFIENFYRFFLKLFSS